ncbi:MAG: methyltransferase domain-containing protein [Flavobacteriales bacterium]|nr:methyltransferase domain-containing protein [Flavobacteriales bacterium]
MKADGKFSWNRPITSYTKFHQLFNRFITPFILNKKMFVPKKLVQGKEYLQIGCGYNIYDNFINTDIEWKPNVIPWDISTIKRHNYPVENESLRGIYTEHCLEHIPFQSTWDNLREFYRMLKTGGTVRIAVPDGGLFIDLYNRHNAGEKVKFPAPDDRPEPTPMISINRIARSHGHLFLYDFETFKYMLEDVGFKDVKQETFRNGRHVELLVDSVLRREESLYVEATK